MSLWGDIGGFLNRAVGDVEGLFKSGSPAPDPAPVQAAPTPQGAQLSVQPVQNAALSAQGPAEQQGAAQSYENNQNKLKVSQATPPPLLMSGQKFNPGGTRTGVQDVPPGNLKDKIVGASGGVLSSAAKQLANTVKSTTDVRWATPNYIPGVKTYVDPLIARASTDLATPFTAAQKKVDQVAQARGDYSTKAGQSGKKIGNVVGTTAILAPQVAAAAGDVAALASKAPEAAAKVGELVDNRVPLNQAGFVGIHGTTEEHVLNNDKTLLVPKSSTVVPPKATEPPDFLRHSGPEPDTSTTQHLSPGDVDEAVETPASRSIDADREVQKIIQSGGTRDQAAFAHMQITGSDIDTARADVDRVAQESDVTPKSSPNGEGSSFNPTGNKAERLWQGLNNADIQGIVYNPAFHGRNLNQLAGMAAGKVSPFGPAALKANYLRIFTMSKADKVSLLNRMVDSGTHIETYGGNRETAISKALDKVHLPHFNKMNANVMSAIDTHIRMGLFDLMTRGGKLGKFNDAGASAEVNRFLGDKNTMGQVAKDIGMFWHYKQTQLRAAGQIRNPKVALAFAEQQAIHFGVQKAFQEWTGNKHATTGNPGVFGLQNNAAQLIHGQWRPVASSLVNPLTQTAIDQATGKSLYSGQPITNRKADLEQTLGGTTPAINKVMSGKNSPLQTGLQLGIGANLPHVTGAPAAPNFTTGVLSKLNAAKSRAVAGGDKTGIDQANAYFGAIDKSLKGASKADTDAINKYLDRQLNAAGQKISGGTVGGYVNAKDLLVNASQGGQALKRVYAAEHSQKNNDPLWQLPLSAPDGKPSVTNFYKVESQYEGNEKDGVKIKEQGSVNSGWITNLETQRNAFYNKLPPGNGALAREPAYPTPTGQTASDIKTADGITNSTQFSQYLTAHPDVTDAFANIAKWTNQIRALEGGPQLPATQQASPQTQQIINTYNALPPSKTAGNTNPATSGMRSAWIKANPQAYSQMVTFYAQSSMTSLLKNAITAVYSGDTANNQAVLKNVKSLSTDVQTNKNGTLSLGPSSGTSGSSSSGSSSGSSSSPGYLKLDQNLPVYRIKANHPRKIPIRLSKDYMKGAKIFAKVPQQGKQKGLPIATF